MTARIPTMLTLADVTVTDAPLVTPSPQPSPSPPSPNRSPPMNDWPKEN